MSDPNVRQVYQVFIKTTPEKLWEAITKPEFTSKYFHGSLVSVEQVAGGRIAYRSPDGKELWVDAKVVECDPPRRLVHTWNALWTAETAKEKHSRVTYEIEPLKGGVCKLTAVHDELEGAPITAQRVAGGWSLILSGLKTLLETGRPLGEENPS